MRQHRRSAWAAVFAATLWAGAAVAAPPPASATTHSPVTYYVDSVSGKDGGDGTSEATAWKTLAYVSAQSATKLLPGDTVEFKRGETFAGQLKLVNTDGALNSEKTAEKGSGTAGAPITYGSYGTTGALPILTGSDGGSNNYCTTILVKDVDHLAFNNIQIENPRTVHSDSFSDTCANGLQIINTGRRNLSGYTISNVTVANVNSLSTTSFDSNFQAGISVDAQTSATTTDSITVENSTFQYGTRFGIAINPDPQKVPGSTPVQNVVIRNNTCDHTGGSCILVRYTQNALVSKNDIEYSGSKAYDAQIGRGSGGWVMGSTNVAIDGNTSEHSQGDGDSAGFHIDAHNTNVLMQHNFFYDAEGYGIEVLGNNSNAIVRYNVIADCGWRQPNGGMVMTNDYDPVFPKGVSDGLYIYNNTVSFDKDQTIPFLIGMKNSKMYNNIFEASSTPQITPQITSSPNVTGTANNTIEKNLFTNADPNLTDKDAAPVLAAAPGFQGGTDRANPDTYKLSATSPARNKGVVGADWPDPTFGALGTGIFSNFPSAPTKDFYGNTLPANVRNIGADQG